jgi:hypothetical protein
MVRSKAISVIAYFNGDAGDPLDQKCHSIFVAYGGKLIGEGTHLGERDIEYEVPQHKADAVCAALKKAGFRLKPTSH